MRFPVLQRLIAPVDAAAFLESHWGKRSIHVAGDLARLDGLERDDWLEHASELDAASVDAGGHQRQSRIRPAEVAALYASGSTICADVSRHPAVSSLLVQLAFELGLAGAPFAKLYSSPDEGGFAVHFDSFHVFVLQLSGAKRWRFSRAPVVESPLASGKLDEGGRPIWSLPGGGAPITTDQGEPIGAPDIVTFDEVELTPGDCLYLPPGAWHVARARGHSVAVSLSPPRTSAFALFTRVLEDHLTRHAQWRRDVFTDAPFDGSGRIPEPLARQLERDVASLRGLLDELDPRTIHRVWRLNVLRPAAATLAPADARPITIDDTFVHNGAEVSRYLVASQPGGLEEIYFYAAGEELSLPVGALTFVIGLAKAPRFSGREACLWDGALSWEDVRGILQQLVEADLLRRSG